MEWALATRFQPDTDLVIVSDVLGSPLDPSTKPGYITAKMGMDATKPLDHAERFEKVRVPIRVREEMQSVLARYLGDPKT